MADVSKLSARRAQLIDQISNLAAEIESLRRALRDLQSRLSVTPDETNRQRIQRTINDINARLQERTAQESRLKQELDSVNQQISVAAKSTQGPVVSAGTVVREGQAARDDGAGIANPSPTVASAAGPGISNAQPFQPNPTEGINAQTRPISATQQIPPPTAPDPIPSQWEAEGFDDPTATSVDANQTPQRPTPTQQRGTGSPSDDAVQPATPTSTVDSAGSSLVSRFDRAIVPQDNVLDKYASYTYSLSIYIMSPQAYSQMLSSKRKTLNGSNLLIQSGGAPITGRNQEFPLDFYIDDMEMEQVMPGRGTHMAHNVTKMKFRIFEPNGISLLPRLYAAAKKYVANTATTGQTDPGENPSTVKSSNANQNYAAQNYLMVIRFYGYDDQGNIITDPTSYDAAQRTDANAIVEKFIPFQFTNIRFKIANKITEYDCECVCPQNQVAMGQGRGVIPFNIELTATTLKNLLGATVLNNSAQDPGANARDQNTTAGAPEKANSAPSPTLVTGLAEALNRFQDELVAKGVYTKPDRYKFVISHSELAESSVVPPGPVDKKLTPNVTPNTAGQAKDPDQQSVNNNAKTSSSTAGQSIMQFLNMAVQRTEFITNQQTKLKTKDENGNPKELPAASASSAMAWFRVGVQAKPIGDVIDPKRGDYPYEITYEIAPFGINDMKSEYFPGGKFRGTQKRYAYWFSGENTQILDFEQDFNYLYYITVTGSQKDPSQNTASYREVERRIYAAASPESTQGAENGVFDPVATAADYLYSPSDFAKTRMTILGDPAWIAQGEVWSGIRGLTNNSSSSGQDAYFDAFLSDGTINFDSQEALFELSWNLPEDYNLYTGLMGIQGDRTNR